MQTNAVPHYDDADNPTGCCPRFDPTGWDGRDLHFRDKPFLRATTRSLAYFPLNMGRVFSRVQGRIERAGAYDPDDFLVLSRDLSPWRAEHLFSATAPVKGEDAVTLSGDFVTKVFEGPYRRIREWHGQMRALARARGGTGDEVYFFYTTCPRCAKVYGKNYVVGVARTG
ncbi:hypothetical protein ILP92_15920 [Maribius pontilimi]|uniref:Uncharacterized protein n=1 Tax=Palleronia pontilimi TaxID=1964209 RepID=A0A934MF83_9RHOB|nr:hydrolase [Palleronia pontilimi]MBJ3764236.1 hypothetical protein [Palleronia pontilimi]